MHNLGAEAFKKVLDTLPNSIYIKDVDGRYTWLNKSCIKQLTSRHLIFDSIIGKTDFDVFPYANAAEYAKNDKKVMETNQSLVSEEDVILPSGEHLTQLSFKEPLCDDESSELLGVLGYTIDITEIKKKEVELHQAKINAEAANRAKTEFLANMSHDVKSPLTGIVGMADIMAHDTDARDIERKRAEAIYACGMQVVTLFNSCLELSQLEMQEWSSIKEEFSLQQMLQDVVALFTPNAEIKKLTLSAICDSALPGKVEGHRASIYRVILNLVGNALKFTEQGGVIIRAFLVGEHQNNQIEIGISVQDTGPGIPEDKQDIIFEKLRRLTPSYEGKVEGHGIGLYVADQYVKRMGGHIKVKSQLGRGSTFTVFLPMTITKKITSNETKTSNIALIDATQKAPKILLVEDQPMIQMITKTLLNDSGFQVDIATTGAEAIAAFSPGKYDLIYMDIGLPDFDGYVVTQMIREKEQSEKATKTPIIALTGHAAIDVCTFCGKAGMQGVISKPINRKQIEQVWKRYGENEKVQIEGFTLI